MAPGSSLGSVRGVLRQSYLERADPGARGTIRAAASVNNGFAPWTPDRRLDTIDAELSLEVGY